MSRVKPLCPETEQASWPQFSHLGDGEESRPLEKSTFWVREPLGTCHFLLIPRGWERQHWRGRQGGPRTSPPSPRVPQLLPPPITAQPTAPSSLLPSDCQLLPAKPPDPSCGVLFCSFDQRSAALLPRIPLHPPPLGSAPSPLLPPPLPPQLPPSSLRGKKGHRAADYSELSCCSNRRGKWDGRALRTRGVGRGRRQPARAPALLREGGCGGPAPGSRW